MDNLDILRRYVKDETVDLVYLDPSFNSYPRLSDAIQRKNEEARAEREEANDVHLRSANKVTGYRIGATDGDIGHVEDFIIDDETWEIRYMVVDTQNWWPGKKVLVAPQWIGRMLSTGSTRRRFTITTNGRSIGTLS